MGWIWIEAAKNGIVNGALLALLAVSFSWVYRTTRVFHIAIATQVLAGGYAAVLVSRQTPSFTLALLAAVVSAEIVSMMLLMLHTQLQRRDASNSLRLIASVGSYFFAAGLASLWFGNDIKRGSLHTIASWQWGHVIVTSTDICYVGVLLFTLVFLAAVLRLPVGKGIAAVRSNRRLYAALGHDERQVNLLVHIVSGAVVGLCGGFEALRNGVEPYGYLPMAVSAAVAALLGGHSMLLGPVLAGLLMGVLKSSATLLFSDAWADTSIYGVLFIMVCVWPRLILAPATEEERP
jgi:branched-chain amino acid transport system permease protein